MTCARLCSQQGKPPPRKSVRASLAGEHPGATTATVAKRSGEGSKDFFSTLRVPCVCGSHPLSASSMGLAVPWGRLV